MAKPPSPDSPTESTEPLEDSFYEVPSELQDGGAPPEGAAGGEADREPSDDELAGLRGPKRFPAAIVSAAALAAICIAGGLVAYRCHGQQKVVREGILQAEQLMQLDTAEGYRKAANLLAPLAKLDPLEAGSERAFALAMLACDYRDAAAEEEANRLLVVPGRADPLPRYAALAFRALALGRDALADAALDRGAPEEAAAGAGGSPGLPWAKTLSARVDLSAGSYESAVEFANAAAAVPGFVPGLAVHGDAFRRARRDYRTALSAYEAALAASPTHPRAAFGLAKLALAGQAPEAEARAALGRVLATGEATPRRARARAALHLAALRLRAGDPVDAVRADATAALASREPAPTVKELDWLMGGARAEAANRGAYRAVADAPEIFKTKTDDDLEDKGFRALAPAPPPPPPPVVEPPRPAPHPAKVVKAAKGHAAPAKASKAGAKGAKAKAKKTAAPAKATAKKKAKKTTSG